jgi:hypothetical protein
MMMMMMFYAWLTCWVGILIVLAHWNNTSPCRSLRTHYVSDPNSLMPHTYRKNSNINYLMSDDQGSNPQSHLPLHNITVAWQTCVYLYIVLNECLYIGLWHLVLHCKNNMTLLTRTWHLLASLAYWSWTLHWKIVNPVYEHSLTFITENDLKFCCDVLYWLCGIIMLKSSINCDQHKFITSQ